MDLDLSPPLLLPLVRNAPPGKLTHPWDYLGGRWAAQLALATLGVPLGLLHTLYDSEIPCPIRKDRAGLSGRPGWRCGGPGLFSWVVFVPHPKLSGTHRVCGNQGFFWALLDRLAW